MQQLFVGTISARIESPAGLDEAGRRLYADAFLRALEEQLNRRSKEVSVEFRLISADRGCIWLRAALVLKVGAVTIGAGIAGMVLLDNPETLQIAKYLGSRLQTEFNCRVGGKAWACKLLTCRTTLSTQFHYTSDGDTLETVLRDKFNVRTPDMPAAIARMRKWYSGALVSPTSTQLKPRNFIAYLGPGMCIEAEPIRSSLLIQ